MSVRTTLTLDDDVFQRLQQQSRSQGEPFKKTVNDIIRIGLIQSTTPSKPLVIKSKKMGLLPGLNYDNIGELLEQIEGPGYK